MFAGTKLIYIEITMFFPRYDMLLSDTKAAESFGVLGISVIDGISHSCQIHAIPPLKEKVTPPK